MYRRGGEGQKSEATQVNWNKTDKKNAELALKDSEERWQYALKAANEGMWGWNLKTDTVYYSRQWRRIVGYRADELEEKWTAWTRIIHPDDVKKFIDATQEHL